jgi:hypothetical protein
MSPHRESPGFSRGEKVNHVVETRLGVDRDEYGKLIATALEECEHHHSRYVIPYAYGRKPPRTR